MKLRKTISALCAVAMLATALPAASAAKVEPISDAAGETVAVHVTHISADGQRTQNYVNVAIPENATCQDEHKLIQSAALATVGSRARYNDLDFLYEGARVSLTTAYKSINSIYLHRDYDYIVFEFNGGSCSGNPTNVTLRLSDGNCNTFTLNAPLTIQYQDLKCAEVTICDGEMFRGKKVSLGNGDYLEMEAKLNRGSATFAGFIVKGYY